MDASVIYFSETISAESPGLEVYDPAIAGVIGWL
jgi:hypothetical protein